METKFKVGQKVKYLENDRIKEGKIKMIEITDKLRYVLDDGYYANAGNYAADSRLEEHEIFSTMEEAETARKFRILLAVRNTVNALNEKLKSNGIKVRVEMIE